MKKVIIVLIILIGGAVIFFSLPKPTADLFSAIKEKNVLEVKRILSEYKIELDPPRKSNEVNKPLAYAAAYGNLDIVKILVAKGADMNGQVAYGDVPIIKAVEHDNRDIVKYLLINGADVNIPNVFGVSPFIGFCAMGEEDFVRMALAHGAKIDEAYEQLTGEAKGKKNWTALQSAVAYGQLPIVKLLIEKGGDPFVKDAQGKNSFELAKDKGQVEVLQYLLFKYRLQNG